MSKRPAFEEAQDHFKRHKTQHANKHGAPDHSTKAPVTIADRAEELIDCLQSLKAQASQLQTSPRSHIDETKREITQLYEQLLPSIEALGPSSNSHPRTAELPQARDDDAAALLSGVPLPSVISVTPWVASEIQRNRPSLPKILNPALEEEAFTHPGLGLKYNYERLEWLGDAYLELIATALIHQTFGQLASGRCSQMRERLIRNVNLAEYFRHYGMKRFAKLPSDFGDGRGPGRGRSADKDLIKTQADMFEAYVAAVILSDPQHGLSTTVEWLKALWAGTIEDDIRKAENASKACKTVTTAEDPNSAAPEVSAKEWLARKIVVPGVSLQYRDLPCEKKDKNLGLPLFSIGVYLDGWGEKDRLLAVGTALKKKEASQKAANTVLQNRKLMKVYEEKKRAYQQAREADKPNT